LFNEMNAAGLEIVRDFRTWIATLDGTQRVHDMTGVTDESIVYDDNWHRH
jgi:hypothetical protein